MRTEIEAPPLGSLARSIALCLLVVTSLAQGAAAAGEIRDVYGLEFLGQAVLPPMLEFEGTWVGGLSAIAWDRPTGTFFVASDDPGTHGPARLYQLRIAVESGGLPKDGVGVVSTIVLKDRDGRPFPNSRVDLEGVVKIPGGGLIVSSEGQIRLGAPPFIRQFADDGTYIRDFEIPPHYLNFEDRTFGLRHNLAFESLTLTPDGRYLVTASENALNQDVGTATPERSSPSRILVLDFDSGDVEGEYFYWTDRMIGSGAAEDYEYAGLVDLVALDRWRLLAIERFYAEEYGNSVRIFRIDLTHATDLNQGGSEGEQDPASTVAASKELLVDLADLEVDLDNIEGMGLGPALEDGRRTLVLVGDDNFNPQFQQTQILAFAVSSEPTGPSAIQGRGHRSPIEDHWVRGVEATVSALFDQQHFWIQSIDDMPVGSPSGLRVVAPPQAPGLAVGDRVRLNGRIREAGKSGELPVTTLVASSVEVIDRGQPLEPDIELGGSGRSMPSVVVDNDRLQFFDPEFDGIDFWESLEGSRVSIADARVIGATDRYGDVVVTIADKSDVGQWTFRDGFLLRADDPNPERILLSFGNQARAPEVNVGDRFQGAIVGVVDYEFGSYRVRVVGESPDLIRGSLAAETTRLEPRKRAVTVATINAYNLSTHTDARRMARLARSVVVDLRSPDVLAFQEIQDDSGPEDDGVVSAEQTIRALIAAIREAGGPVYDYRQIDPIDGSGGGYPGANIRVVVMFNPKRIGVKDDVGSAAGHGVEITSRNSATLFTPNPGLIAPHHIAFAGMKNRFGGSRRVLAVELEFRGRRLVVVACHLNSKRSDSGLYGVQQPPAYLSEDQRSQQAALIGGFVGELLAVDPDLAVVVLGDLNEHEFRPPLRVLRGGLLANLIDLVPANRRYTFNYRGNSQVLDHILVSPWLADRAEVEIIHNNVDFAAPNAASDHDPVIARFNFARRK